MIVHDDTTAKHQSKSARKPPPPKDDADVAFADSRGKDRKRTEEGYRVFTEDELKLNSGGGTCILYLSRHTLVSV